MLRHQGSAFGALLFLVCTSERFNILENKSIGYADEYTLIIIIMLLKEVGSARLRASDMHPISPKTPSPQYQPIDRKKRKVKIVEDYSRGREVYANKKALALLLKPANPTPSNTGSARSFQRDTDRGTKDLRYCDVLQ